MRNFCLRVFRQQEDTVFRAKSWFQRAAHRLEWQNDLFFGQWILSGPQPSVFLLGRKRYGSAS